MNYIICQSSDVLRSPAMLIYQFPLVILIFFHVFFSFGFMCVYIFYELQYLKAMLSDIYKFIMKYVSSSL